MKDCKFGNCQKYDQKHNTLLHEDRREETSLLSTASDINVHQEHEVEEEVVTVLNAVSKSINNQILMATAMVQVWDKQHRSFPCRVLLDSASQTNFVSEEFASKFQLFDKAIPLSISGINGIRTKSIKKLKLSICSNYANFSTSLEFYVLPQITGMIPTEPIDIGDWDIPADVQLADSEFNIPKKIEMLGLTNRMPVLQETHFGWIVAGSNLSNVQEVNFHVEGSCHISLNDSLERFWQIECYQETSPSDWSIEEKACERSFLTNRI